MKNILFIMLLLGVVSCTKPESDHSDGKINLATSILSHARIDVDETGKGSFTTGDVISLAVSGTQSTQQVLDFEIGQTELYWQDLDLPSSQQTVDFVGCYPALSQVSGSIGTFDVFSAKEKDLLLTTAVSANVGTSTPINMTFSHVLHRLKITYDSRDYAQSELQSITTKCKAKSVCEVNLATGTISRVLSQSATFTSTSPDAVFLLPPQECAGVTITVELSGRSEEFNLAAWLQEAGHSQTTLLGGKELQLTINVNKEGISFGNMNIIGWGDQGSVDGDIIL